MDGTGDWDDFDTAAALIAGATTAVELFGPAQADRIAAARSEYRRLARLCHPDRHGIDRRPLATAAFTRLATLWQSWQTGPDAGPGGTPPPVVLTTTHHTWRVGPFIDAGDATNRYEGTDADDPSRRVSLEIPRRAMDSDFVAHEAAVLTHLAASVDDQWRPYLPELVESFRHRDAEGFDRQINVIEPLTGFVSLETVRAAYPDGLDPRDVAWMWRRLLVALGAAHHAGVVHGAVLPDRVMIHPAEHGLVLREWGHAVLAPGGRVLAVAARYKDWYPPEVPARRPAGPPTDIFLATRTMAWLMGEHIPRALRAFVDGCTLAAPAMRPADAWELLEELDDLIERLWGPRRFRPLHLPTT
jgi:hypothetical protein